ncbi:MAG: hypothetical protein EBR23_08010, partial [Planctomycetia bacterium]|nr:hypothetical protein [Planctomycetia bacterium]
PDRSAAAPGVAARVNGDSISIDEVRTVSLERYGRDVLEILITRTLVEQALKRQQQTLSQADLDAEIARAAATMGFQRPDGKPDTAAWLERVTREEKIPLRHYMEDIVWPTVALKRLVGTVPVSQEDLDKAFKATFGPRARCRIIVLDSQRRAQEVWQLARQNLTAEHIGNLAENYSVDPTTRSLRGEVPPIQRWGGQPALEREAFALKPGELSGVVQVADRFMVVFCEGFTEPARVSFEEVRGELYDDIHEKKQRIEMARHFTHLRESATIDNFLAGTSQAPAAPGRQTPGEAGMPAATLSKAEAAEMAQPRAGSRRAAPAASKAGSGSSTATRWTAGRAPAVATTSSTVNSVPSPAPVATCSPSKSLATSPCASSSGSRREPTTAWASALRPRATPPSRAWNCRFSTTVMPNTRTCSPGRCMVRSTAWLPPSAAA